MPIIPLTCQSCGANITVDSSKDAAICEYCGKPYIVKDAIVNTYINLNVGQATIHADSINLNAQKDFDIKAGTLIKYNGENQDVVIPNNVTEIGDSAFADMSIKSVSIPDGVTRIGEEAFARCRQLKTIVIPEGVTEIGSYAFAGCTQLKTIVIPESVTKIGSYAFSSSGLTSLHLPASVSSVGYAAFVNCSDLQKVEVFASTEIGGHTEIGARAFEGTPFWAGKCQVCGRLLTDAPFYEKLRGYSKICKKCGRVYV